MHHPTDSITHIPCMTFVTPVIKEGSTNRYIITRKAVSPVSRKAARDQFRLASDWSSRDRSNCHARTWAPECQAGGRPRFPPRLDTPRPNHWKKEKGMIFEREREREREWESERVREWEREWESERERERERDRDVLINDALNTFFSTVIWRQTYG